MTFRSFSCPYRPCHNIEQIFSRCRIVLWPKASSRIRGLPVFLRPDGLRRLPWKSRPTGWYILTPVPYPCPGRRTLAPSSPYSSRQPAFFPAAFPLPRRATTAPGGFLLFPAQPSRTRRFPLVTPTAPVTHRLPLYPRRSPTQKI